MAVVWLTGTVGAGKTAVGRALAALLPDARFLDGDDLAGPRGGPPARRWERALAALLRQVARRDGRHLVIAYPLQPAGWRRLRAAAGRAQRPVWVVALAPPPAVVMSGRGRKLSSAERRRVRRMRGQGYDRPRFAALRLANAAPPPARTAARIARLLRLTRLLRLKGAAP